MSANEDNPFNVLVLGIEERVTVVGLRYRNGKVRRLFENPASLPIDPKNPARSAIDCIQYICNRGKVKLSNSIDRVVISHAGAIQKGGAKPEWIWIARPGWKRDEQLTPEALLAAIPGEWNGIPICLNDATAHAIAEHHAQISPHHQDGRETFCYIRIGEGINAGVIRSSNPYEGSLHPEIGHIMCPPYPRNKPLYGYCAHHDACAEGLITYDALQARYGTMPYRDLWQLPSSGDTPAPLELVARHCAFLCSVLALTLAPFCIIVGGAEKYNENDPLNHPVPKVLLDRIRIEFSKIMNDYPTYSEAKDTSMFIRPAVMGQSGNVYGGFLRALSGVRAKRLRDSLHGT